MHRLRQLWWGLRAIALMPFFGKIGMPSYIAPTTFLLGSRRIFLGRRVRILPGLRAEAHGDGRIFIHDNVAIGQDFHIAAGGDLHVGAGTLISGSVMITDLDHEYSDVTKPVSEQPMVYKRTEVGEKCFIGIGARLQAGTVLGDGCIVGTNSVVRGVFAPHSVIVGAPARVVKTWNNETQQWERVQQ